MADNIAESMNNEESSGNSGENSSNSLNHLQGTVCEHNHENNTSGRNQSENIPLELSETAVLVPTILRQGGSSTMSDTSNNAPSSNAGMLPIVSRDGRAVQTLPQNCNPSTSSIMTHSSAGNDHNEGYMSFKSALEFLPKFYDGQNIPVSKFARDCMFAQESILPKERPLLLRMVRSRLRGDADLYLQDQEINSLENLLNDLKAVFSPHENVQDLTAMLSTVGQKTDETAEAYGVRVRKILNKLVTAIEHENAPEISYGMVHAARASAIINFMRGLKKELEWRVRFKNPKTLQEATSFAKAAEWEVSYQEGLQRETISSENEDGDLKKNNKFQSHFQERFTPYRPKRMSRVFTFDATHDGETSRSMGRSVNSKQLHTTSQHGNNSYNVSNCYNCGKAGHLARGCLMKKSDNWIQCYACGKVGHMARDCNNRKTHGNFRKREIEGNAAEPFPKRSQVAETMKFGKSHKDRKGSLN